MNWGGFGGWEKWFVGRDGVLAVGETWKKISKKTFKK